MLLKFNPVVYNILFCLFEENLGLVNGLLVRVLEKAVSGFDFTKTQLTGTVLGFLKRIKKTDS